MPSPHWLGEHQAWPVSRMQLVSPSIPGLKTCLPRTRTRNFAPMAMAAARGGTQSASVRSRSDSPSPVMSGERNPLDGSPRIRSQAHWTAARREQQERRHPGLDLQPEHGHPEDQEGGEEGDLEIAGIAREQALERTHRPP